MNSKRKAQTMRATAVRAFWFALALGAGGSQAAEFIDAQPLAQVMDPGVQS